MIIKEIKRIEFGILSTDEIEKMSVAEINVHKNKLNSFVVSEKNNEMSLGTLYDIRTGPMNSSQICPTCSYPSSDCSGHFSYINLNTKVIHPLFCRYALSFLRCFCVKCSNLLMDKESMDLLGISKLRREKRFEILLTELSKIRFCIKCKTTQPKYVFSINDHKFYANYKNEGLNPKIEVTTDEIMKIFNNISNADVELLGFNPNKIHPRDLVLTVLPVIPPRSRPFIVTDNIICDDDLTISYTEIIKANNNLLNDTISESKRQKNYQSILFRIKTLLDNSSKKAKHSNSRPMKGIKERLTGKNGLFRNNLMGKRVNFSARTVIGPDPTLRVDEIAIPHEIANELTFPEIVNSYNIDKLQAMVFNHQTNFIIRNNNEKEIKIHTKIALKSKLKDKTCTLQYGDRVHRKLIDGDRVLLNRQPTLHKTSMLDKRIKVVEGKTIRLNLATTGTFNADFDGDEMNIFAPQSIEARTELEYISSTKENIVDSQSSVPIIYLVQDVLLSCYLMTRSDEDIPEHIFYQIAHHCDFNYDFIQHKLSYVQHVWNEKKVNNNSLYCGKTLFSLLLPDDFHYYVHNGALKDEPVVSIYKGILYKGAMNKTNLKNNHNSIILHLHNEYSNDVAMDFVNNVQFMGNQYLLYAGFSIGIQDCLCDESSYREIQNVIQSCVKEASSYATSNGDVDETKVNLILNKARDVGMKIAKESLDHRNNFICTVTSGSKGDYFNISQIMGLLGQQNVTGKRVQCQLNKGKRSLPHYPLNEQLNEKELFESKGFIQNSFIKGLNPQEFWYHAMSGREGVTDTALKTANSGYIQRKMVKVMEDIQIKYDQTVRNSVGQIIQFAYGNDNLCGTKTVIKQKNGNKEVAIVDVERMTEQLNSRYENKLLMVKD